MAVSWRSVLGVALALAVSCSAGGGSGKGGASGAGGDGAIGMGPKPGMPLTPGTKVALALSSTDQGELSAIESKLDALEGLTASELVEQRAVSFTELGYDPLTAHNLDLIQASSLALDQPALDKLQAQGFVITPSQAFPHMSYGLKTIYAEDLPVFVSVDSILDAVHLSYDAILKQVELAGLIGDLQAMLNEARQNLRDGAIAPAETAADIDVFLAVALRLLTDGEAAAVAGGNEADIDTFVANAKAARGIQNVRMFGVSRELDFSQFEPRGHYTDSEELGRYFRAMIWLGRTDFRLIETLPDGQQVFHHRQLANMLAVRDLIRGPARDAYQRIDAAVTAFVGEHDYMQLSEVDALLQDLGASTSAEALALDHEQLAQAIVDGGYGAQRIASQVIFKAPGADPGALPLSRSFALLGQRYAVDSHVFSNVVYDRVPAKDGKIRHLPDPLDAAYAALGNASALPLLEPGLEEYGYTPHLERMRVLVDEHGDEFWQQNLYNDWLAALRALSPLEGLQDPATLGMPSVTGTEAWSRRVLNAQLASWAQLRHDTILYVKQSYTTGNACEFPDAYVDPYPEAFARIAQFAVHGRQLVDVLASGAAADLAPVIGGYFAELETVANKLREMAEFQRAGTPFNDEQMAFINDAVRSHVDGCGGPVVYEGWYARILFDKSDDDMDPTIADVHTHPGDNPPPAVLHVATGLPRLMVMTADTCEGPRAYAGVAFSYHEVVTGLDRLTDEDWEGMAVNAPDVPWMKSILP
jgi:hypothetical protein